MLKNAITKMGLSFAFIFTFYLHLQVTANLHACENKASPSNEQKTINVAPLLIENWDQVHGLTDLAKYVVSSLNEKIKSNTNYHLYALSFGAGVEFGPESVVVSNTREKKYYPKKQECVTINTIEVDLPDLYLNFKNKHMASYDEYTDTPYERSFKWNYKIPLSSLFGLELGVKGDNTDGPSFFAKINFDLWGHMTCFAKLKVSLDKN